MIDKKLFDYYTGIKVVVKGKDWDAVDEKTMKKLSQMASNDVKIGRAARGKAEFKNESEYKIYLMELIQSAWNEKTGITPSTVINE